MSSYIQNNSQNEAPQKHFSYANAAAANITFPKHEPAEKITLHKHESAVIDGEWQAQQASDQEGVRERPKISFGEVHVHTPSRATQLEPRWDLLEDGKPIALDGEWQMYRVGGKGRHRWGRVAVINHRGETVWDVFFNYNLDKEHDKFLPPPKVQGGVFWNDLKMGHGAIRGHEGEAALKEMMKDRTVIVHDDRGEQAAFFYEENAFKDVNLVDTQKLWAGAMGRVRPALTDCASTFLGGRRMRADGEHSPVEDALATMDLYLLKMRLDEEAREAARAAQLAQSDVQQTSSEGSSDATETSTRATTPESNSDNTTKTGKMSRNAVPAAASPQIPHGALTSRQKLRMALRGPLVPAVPPLHLLFPVRHRSTCTPTNAEGSALAKCDGKKCEQKQNIHRHEKEANGKRKGQASNKEDGEPV